MSRADPHLTAVPGASPGSAVRVEIGAAGGVEHLDARRTDGGWTIEGPLPLGPHLSAALAVLVDACRRTHDGAVQWWAEPAGPATDDAAAAAGLAPDRDLLQLRIPLPAAPPPPLHVRPFVPGHDEDAWLEVNNAAFHWHEDQADWTRPQLAALEAAPWFDPAGFLVHERDGRMLGFCWTKVHVDAHPPQGEIFVIAVHPDAHGRGLGAALTLAGLDHLARAGLTIGMLYVEADNAAARRLYDQLGFTEHHRRRRYVSGS